jgi:hypothetical protein
MGDLKKIDYLGDLLIDVNNIKITLKGTGFENID